MTGIIVTIPPTVEVPPGNNASNPSSLPPVTYTYALLNIPQTWTAKQTFPLGNISLNMADVLGTASVAQGGTGQFTATAAFDALAPTTTRGDLIFRNATTNARLAAGTSGYHLQASGAGTDPAWSGFLQAGTGATIRTWNSKASDFVHVRDFGAVCDGVADDTAAIQAALNTGRLVVLPDAATCKIIGTLTISVAGTGLVGGGMLSSVLTSSSTAAPMISVNAGVNNLTFRGFTLTRSVTASANADGISFAGDTEETLIDNVWVEKQFNGLKLKTTSYSLVSNSVLSANQNDGINCTDTASSGSMQWVFNNILSQTNVARGFLFATTGTHSATLGNHSNLFTFANSSFGYAVVGTVGAPISGVRLYNSFFGQDGNSEVYLDTFSGMHVISGCFLELAGTALTGPTLATAASGVGHGLQTTTNNTIIQVNGCYATGNSNSGYVLDGTTMNLITGSTGTANAGFGIVINDGSKTVATGNSFYSNTTAQISIISNASSLIASGNNPTTLNQTIAVAGGGTGLTSGTSGGVPYFNAANTMAASAALASGQVVAGGGAGAAPATIANGQLPATATNDNAAAGKVGEYVESVVASGSAVALTTGIPANMTSISLTAGDWDIDIVFNFTGGATTTVTYLAGSLSLTTATLDNTVGRRVGTQESAVAAFNNSPNLILTQVLPPLRLSLSATTTVFAVAQAAFGTSTCSVFGILRARRVR